MFKKILLLTILTITSTYVFSANKKVICQISFDVPEKMDKSFHNKPMNTIIEEMIKYPESKKIKIKKNIVGEIKDSFYKKIRKIEGEKIFNIKENYYILDSNDISLSVRKSSCLDYSKKIEMDMDQFRKEKDIQEQKRIEIKLVKEKPKTIKKTVEKSKKIVKKKKKQPVSDTEKDLIKKALELAL